MAKILIVDDRLTNRELMLTLLGYAGHQLLEASEGEEGLAIAQAEYPDLIITDIMMPKMDGYEFARQVRADPIIKDTQIIFYTSSYIVAETHRLARACGVSIVIGKPIEPEEFLKKIGEALNSHHIPTISPASEDFHREHMRMLTDTLVNKVEQLEAEIIERERTEDALRLSELKFSVAFKSAPLALAITTLDGKFIEMNPAFCELVGYSQEEVIGKTAVELALLTQESREKLIAVLKDTGGMISNFEVQFRVRDGSLRDILYSLETISIHGELHRLSTGLDITERKRAEKMIREHATEMESRVNERTIELNHTNAELEYANRAKDEFLATMSHELRTPLNSILGLSESLLEERRGSLNDSQKKSLQVISNSGEHLLELINDILDLSKIEAGKADFYPQDVEVDTLCRSSLNFVKEQAMRKSINLKYEEDTSISKIYADPRRLKQVLINLLTNAVKFTSEGGHVILQLHSDVEQDLVQFSIIDTGIGIAQEDYKKLFQPFGQLDTRLSREFGGTGLGLALVQKLTDLHGGSVQVESEVGKGSRFIVNLPWGKDKITKQEEIESSNKTLSNIQTTNVSEKEISESYTILLAEDNHANILMISEYLESHDYVVVIAHDGVEAIQKAEETNPNLILMDIQMPGLDGLEAMSRLRKDSRFISTPIIALTALAMPGDRERCLAAGANEYMSKPVSLKKLRLTIHQMLNQPE